MKLTPKQLPHPWTPTNPDGMAWYIPAYHPGYYLHRDGVVRQHIFHHGERMGYYASEAEALAAIEAYKANPQESVKPVSELLANLRKSSGNAWDDVIDVRSELNDLRGTEAEEVTP